MYMQEIRSIAKDRNIATAGLSKLDIIRKLQLLMEYVIRKGANGVKTVSLLQNPIDYLHIFNEPQYWIQGKNHG